MIPVDFTLNTEVAISKTLELIDQNSTVHLLHTKKYGSFAGGTDSELEKKLRQWKETIADYDPLISVQTYIVQSLSVQKAIKTKGKGNWRRSYRYRSNINSLHVTVFENGFTHAIGIIYRHSGINSETWRIA